MANSLEDAINKAAESESQAAAARQADAKRLQDEHDYVANRWRQLEPAFQEAISRANVTFKKLGRGERFRYTPTPQSYGDVARGIFYLLSDTGLPRLEMPVSVTTTGAILFRSANFGDTELRIRNLTPSGWDELLVRFFEMLPKK